jgi:uncharacterized repeat protein (TIGR03847 family)
MSRRVFSFDPPDRFVCGAIGQPGERTFFLQASKGHQVVSVALEKVQVAALAERLAALLLSLRERGVDVDWTREPDALPLVEPVFEQFRVGAMTLSWDEHREQVLIEAREMTEADLESEEDEDPEEELVVAADNPEGPDLVRVTLEPADAQAFVTRAVAVMRAGRLPCPNCGEPLDPRGHFCLRRNGYAH